MPDLITGISGESCINFRNLTPYHPAYDKRAGLWGTFLILGTRIIELLEYSMTDVITMPLKILMPLKLSDG